ncbi:putative serine/threonine-protein kinase pim-3 [Triplophysa rosa]|uniref:non-specific serine/threonine protein kinase n=1 Tax=Triplophysa rosa TaxID=992332 RepID=A0A9W7X4Y3_TRIRA|nr:putative serine/threonine-protein kinase pim-3 [Triplophysa rosa]
MRACENGHCPEIVQLLDWQEHTDRYIMVLECPSPCEGLNKLVESQGGELDEELAKPRLILRQAAEAAEVCCKRGVFHRDIKMDNLLINTKTLEVKLIDFGCGDLLKSSTYQEFMGTRKYASPEWRKKRKYQGKTATVYSLGMLLFVMLMLPVRCRLYAGETRETY